MAFQPCINHSLDRWEDVPRLNMGSRIRMLNFDFFDSLAQHSQEYIDTARKCEMPDKHLRHLIRDARRSPNEMVADGTAMFIAGLSRATSFSINIDVKMWTAGEQYRPKKDSRLIITTPDFDSGHLFIMYDSLVSIARYIGFYPTVQLQTLAVKSARNVSLRYLPEDMSEVAGVYLGNFKAPNGIFQVAANLGKLVDAISFVMDGHPYRGSKRNMWVYALMVRLVYVHGERDDIPLPWFEQAERIYSRRLTKWQRVTLDDELRLGASLRLACMLSPERNNRAA